MQSSHYTHDQAAAVIGKSRQAVSDILSLNRLPHEIRGDCRGNAQCPRAILIEIARKKQQRSMLNLYEKYKASGLTSGLLRKERQSHEAPMVLGAVKGAVKKLRAIPGRIKKLEIAALEA